MDDGDEEERIKRQAVFMIDMKIWREAIREFQIVEPIIPHREEISHHGPGTREWYG